VQSYVVPVRHVWMRKDISEVSMVKVGIMTAINSKCLLTDNKG